MKDYEEVVEEVKTEKARVWKKRVWDHLSFDIRARYLANPRGNIIMVMRVLLSLLSFH